MASTTDRDAAYWAAVQRLADSAPPVSALQAARLREVLWSTTTIPAARVCA